MITIRTKLVLAFVAVGVVAPATLAGAAYAVARAALAAAYQETLAREAAIVQTRVGLLIARWRATTVAAASSPATRRTFETGDPKFAGDGIRELTLVETHFRAVLVLDLDGVVVAASDGVEISGKLAGRDWFPSGWNEAGSTVHVAAFAAVPELGIVDGSDQWLLIPARIQDEFDDPVGYWITAIPAAAARRAFFDSGNFELARSGALFSVLYTGDGQVLLSSAFAPSTGARSTLVSSLRDGRGLDGSAALVEFSDDAAYSSLETLQWRIASAASMSYALRGCRPLGVLLASTSLAVVLLSMTGGLVFVNRRITSPLARIAAVAERISHDTSASIDVPVFGADEIGDLAGALRRMLENLEGQRLELEELNGTLDQRVQERTRQLSESLEKLTDTQRRLVDASRKAGMADVATAVLHNVGNVLNSVNVSSSVIASTIQQSKLGGLSRLSDFLAQPELTALFAGHPKAMQVPVYITRLREALGEEQATVTSEIDGLQRNIEHIKAIVTMQQTHAKGGSAPCELISLDEVVRDAITMAGHAEHGVELVHELDVVPPIAVDRHKFVQIVMNLVSNARHAIKDTGKPGRITLRVEAKDAAVHVSVKDTGCGIPPENLSRVFSYGFTTKPDGHGFGLHSSACAAMEMQGTLTCTSDGPGRGATFTLALPVGGLQAQAGATV